MEPVIELVRGYIETDYDYPKTVAALAADIDGAAKEILEGLDGEALEEMRVANDINLKMAPLTPDHHFYIDQGANAHLRMALILCGRKLVELGALDDANDVVLFHYNELRVFMGNPAGMNGRVLVARQGRAGGRTPSGPRSGSERAPRRSSPSRTSTCGASPTSSTGSRARSPARSTGSADRRASSKGSRASSCARTSSKRFARATSSCAR